MTERDTSLEHRLGPRVVTIVTTCALAIAGVGFAIGIRSHEPVAMPVRATPSPSLASPALDAPSYAAIANAPLGPNRNFRSALATLVARPLPEPPKALDPDARTTALTERMQRRAYDGAPPVIPHPITSRKVDSCLACHRDGIAMADHVAPRIPHQAYSSCTQCHVESASSHFMDQPTAGNTFAGFFAPPLSHRAALGAPPVIPHATAMRIDCVACHGLLGREGLRTTHPERQNCLQCHATAASLDFMSPASGPFFLAEHEAPQDEP